MSRWTKVSFTDAAQILDLVGSDEADGQSNGKGQPPHEYCGKLVSDAKLQEATSFIGHALPRYEAIVWAANALLKGGRIDRKSTLVSEILRWIDDPNDDQRRLVRQLSDAQKQDSPEKLLGIAVFLSGGSISEPELPPVLPPPDVSAKLATAALLKSAYSNDNPETFLKEAVALGQSFAETGVAG